MPKFSPKKQSLHSKHNKGQYKRQKNNQEIKLQWKEISLVLPGGQTKTYRDALFYSESKTAKIISEEWDWKDHGIKHLPGINKKCIEAFIYGKDIDKIILSSGMLNQLYVCNGVMDYFKKQGIDIERLESNSALEEFMLSRQQNQKVALFLHSTC